MAVKNPLGFDQKTHVAGFTDLTQVDTRPNLPAGWICVNQTCVTWSSWAKLSLCQEAFFVTGVPWTKINIHVDLDKN